MKNIASRIILSIRNIINPTRCKKFNVFVDQDRSIGLNANKDADEFIDELRHNNQFPPHVFDVYGGENAHRPVSIYLDASKTNVDAVIDWYANKGLVLHKETRSI